MIQDVLRSLLQPFNFKFLTFTDHSYHQHHLLLIVSFQVNGGGDRTVQ